MAANSGDLVADDLADTLGVAAREERDRAGAPRPSHYDGRKAELLHQGDPRVVDPEVDEQDAVHAALRPPAPQDLSFCFNILDNLQHQCELARRKL
jgi:hypothetical protein